MSAANRDRKLKIRNEKAQAMKIELRMIDEKMEKFNKMYPDNQCEAPLLSFNGAKQFKTFIGANLIPRSWKRQ